MWKRRLLKRCQLKFDVVDVEIFTGGVVVIQDIHVVIGVDVVRVHFPPHSPGGISRIAGAAQRYIGAHLRPRS